MATPQPTTLPNPTTDNEETPPTTTQQPHEPVDPQTTTINSNTNGRIQTDPAGTELRVPTTSETSTDLPILSPSKQIDIRSTIGIAVAVIVVIILTITVVVIIVVLFKKHGKTTKGVSVKNVAVPTTANQAYGLTHHDRERVEESIYNYPEVDLGDSIEAKQNEVYATTTDIITEGNEAYATNSNIFTEGNQAYATNIDILTEGNQAYVTNITTEKNTAYKPVTIVEDVDEYDYI